MINLRDFVKYLYSQNNTLEVGQKNIGKIIGKIKSLIYKYYSSPILCFHNNDKNNEGKMDFDKFKNLISDMYSREEMKMPSFTLIKNAFDEIDLRKDGILDLNEWCKAFGNYNSLLDPDEDKISNGEGFFGKKFKKENKQKIKDNDYLIKINEEEFIHYNNFIDLLKDILPNLKISQTQWKMIVNIAQIERTDDLINIKDFFQIN